MQAGVSTELHVYRGAHHGFDRMVPQAAISQRFIADRDAALRYAFSGTATPRPPLPVT
jgi:acetyl esterase/lipase